MIKLSMKNLLATTVFAQETITVSPPPGLQTYSSLSNLVSGAIQVIFAIAALLAFGMLAWGAIQWIMSGGDKEAVGKARQRVIHGLIGLVILSLAFLLLKTIGQLVLGFDLTQGIPLPTPK